MKDNCGPEQVERAKFRRVSPPPSQDRRSSSVDPASNILAPTGRRFLAEHGFMLGLHFALVTDLRRRARNRAHRPRPTRRSHRTVGAVKVIRADALRRDAEGDWE